MDKKLQMDFIEWCDLILKQLAELQNSTTEARQYGVTSDKLAEALFGSTTPYQPGYLESSQRIGLLQATEELMKAGLVSSNGTYNKITPQGKRFISDPTNLWTQYCSVQLDADQSNLLKVTNQLSVHNEVDHSYMHQIESESLLTNLDWEEKAKADAIAHELGQQYGLLKWHGRNDSFTVEATYKGLIWDTRREYTIDSRHIDDLVAEWETTSVDFKRELQTDTADQKAEFIKDILGLTNTKAGNKRWMIIGFEDKTHDYHGVPNAKITQNHLENLLSVYTSPVVRIKYDIVDYRKGKVGRLEVFRDPTELPYRVAKSVGSTTKGGKRIETGQIFVRHGSQTEEPTTTELAVLIEEAMRAQEVS